jgi:hypothetical protein|tara:strand:+ start:127 stop:360 length:234 start_codon:yes stop_codon:yes gene_type:complete
MEEMKITKTEHVADGFIIADGGLSIIFKTVRKSEICGLCLWGKDEVFAGYVNLEATPAALKIMESLGIEVGEAKVYL